MSIAWVILEEIGCNYGSWMQTGRSNYLIVRGRKLYVMSQFLHLCRKEFSTPATVLQAGRVSNGGTQHTHHGGYQLRYVPMYTLRIHLEEQHNNKGTFREHFEGLNTTHKAS